MQDYVRHTANSVHYTSDQDLAVIEVRHRLSRTEHLTFIKAQGKPSGAYKNYTTRIQEQPIDLVLNSWEWVNENRFIITAGTATAIVRSIPPAESALELHFKPFSGVRSIGLTVTSSTGDIGTDIIDLTTAGVGTGLDFTYRFAGPRFLDSTGAGGFGRRFAWGSNVHLWVRYP